MLRILVCVVLPAVVMSYSAALPAEPADDAGLRVATFRCDVTPPPGGHPLIWVTPVETVETPLLAKGIVLDDGRWRYVLCAVDWCGLCNSSHLLFCRKIAAAAGTDVSRVTVHCVHQHTAPYTDGDAQRLLDKEEDPPKYVDFKFLDEVTDRLAAAVKQSLDDLQPFDRIGTGEAKVDRVASTRRIPIDGGKVRTRMSSCTDPKLRAMTEGKIDPMLKTITLARTEKPLVRMHYYATHPQSFYGDPRACSDVPGFARERLEKKEGVFQIYFTGCAGDVAMGKYNDRTRRARSELTDRLYAGMEASVASTRLVPAERLDWRTVPLLLPPRTDPGYTVDDNRAKMADPKVDTVGRIRCATRVAFTERIKTPLQPSVLQIGGVQILHLPGECMLEFQLFAQGLRPDDFVAVAAYGDLAPGYICTERSFAEGGYEPTASRAGTTSEAVLKAAIGQLLENQQTKKKKEPYEIRQGGYVEKVDPNVDYQDRLPRIPPREPAESLAAFHIIPGFRVELVAAEPMICDAVDMVFDENGRMYVAEMIPYAEGNSSQFGSPNGRVSLLEDTDGDGRFDTSTIFVDKLVWPTGVTCFDGGVFIIAAPDLLYCKDTDGDGKADVREVVITGFEVSNPNALPNSLRWGLDGRIHGMTSTAGGMLRAVKWERGGEGRRAKPVQARGRDFSVHPRTGQLRLESGGSQFGMTFDRWGRKFESSNSAPIEMVMYDDRYIARNPSLAAPSPRVRISVDGNTVYRTSPVEPWRAVRTEMRVEGVFSGPVEGGGTPAGYFTAACGVTIYNGHAWPKAFHGNAFVAEGSGNLVHRMRLQPDGVAFTAHRTEQKREFLTSDEIWFRPIQFCGGPDGTLYMADMYRELFEHPDAVPPSAKKHLDLTAGNDRGRVYRIVPEGPSYKKQPKPVRLGETSTAELVQLLAHPNGWHRITASRLLYQRQDRRAIEPLVKLAAESPSPLGRMHAMYVLAGDWGLGISAEVVLGRLDDVHPRVREHAVRLAERVLGKAPAVREKLYGMVDDEDIRVRYQLAFTLGEIPGRSSQRATAALAAIAAGDVGDRWIRLAVLSSCRRRAGELVSLLAADPNWRATRNGRTFLEQLAEQTGLQNHSDQVAEVLNVLDRLNEEEKDLAESMVRGLSKGLNKVGSPLSKQVASGGFSQKAGQVLADMLRHSKALAADPGKPVEQRVEAVRSLALASFEEAGEILGELLDGRQPQEVQMAALRTLGRFRGPLNKNMESGNREHDVAELIVAAWGGLSPKVRGEAAEALFARPERLATLLAAVERRVIAPSQLDPGRIQLLLSHPDEQLRRRAEDLLGDVKLARREDVVAAYGDALKLKADASRGKAVFKQHCAKCHRLEGVGYDLGLPLGTVASRGRQGILSQILDPNREVNPAYLNYTLLTRDGLTITGMIAAETATSVTLTRAENESDTVLRANIDELQSTGLSIMPEGLEKQINQQDMADVIEYLISIP